MSERRPRLEGKVAIVTGAGSSGPGIGNGKATAVLFAREGAKVFLVDAFADRAQETLAAIRQEGGDASVFQADVTSDDDCHSLVEAAIQRYERLDILVNNVGISKRGSVLDVTEEEWDRVMAVNVKSMMLTSRHAIPRMMETGGGSIINISSTAGLRAHHSTPYTASKAAVIGLTFSMAADHGRDNVRVNCIAPRPRLHAHGGPADGRRPPRPSPRRCSPRRRGDRMGHRLRRPLPRQRRGPLGYRCRPSGGRWAHRHHAYHQRACRTAGVDQVLRARLASLAPYSGEG